MRIPMLILAGGLIALVLVMWLRGRRRTWANDQISLAMMGYALPLWCFAMIVAGGSGLAQGWLNRDHIMSVIGPAVTLGLLVLGFLTLFGLPMPGFLLPRWVRLQKKESDNERPSDRSGMAGDRTSSAA